MTDSDPRLAPDSDPRLAPDFALRGATISGLAFGQSEEDPETGELFPHPLYADRGSIELLLAEGEKLPPLPLGGSWTVTLHDETADVAPASAHAYGYGQEPLDRIGPARTPSGAEFVVSDQVIRMAWRYGFGRRTYAHNDAVRMASAAWERLPADFQWEIRDAVTGWLAENRTGHNVLGSLEYETAELALRIGAALPGASAVGASA
ncbi:hypothetical protein Bequi_09815 [Brachybacterium sp. JHP9]|uniref:Uncharacterized protein n=1 Tax=Brachybacterium equifaecis TaxID=2910770 RepID=A0ABT0R354_9MICO|nr:hypothetical protein [Brachybacterium equifaecis]MCL6423679.1 hypothetical protein [Brachybacterium equifaecis]